jgi:hypothetical protein
MGTIQVVAIFGAPWSTFLIRRRNTLQSTRIRVIAIARSAPTHQRVNSPKENRHADR